GGEDRRGAGRLLNMVGAVGGRERVRPRLEPLAGAIVHREVGHAAPDPDEIADEDDRENGEGDAAGNERPAASGRQRHRRATSTGGPANTPVTSQSGTGAGYLASANVSRL